MFHKVDDLAIAIRTALSTNNFLSAPSAAAEAAPERTAPLPTPRNFAARLALSSFAVLSRILWRLEVIGIDNLPSTSAFILCPNHESYLDIFWVAAVLPKDVRDRLCCFAKQEFFHHSLTRIITHLASAIPTDRNGDILPTLRAGATVLKDNRPLLIHPEGTRTRTGELLPFRRGAAKLAIENQVPLVPVRLVGSYEIFPPHERLPRIWNWKQKRCYTLKVIFGTPIPPPSVVDNTTEQALTDQLRQAIQALGKRECSPDPNSL